MVGAYFYVCGTFVQCDESLYLFGLKVKEYNVFLNIETKQLVR